MTKLFSSFLLGLVLLLPIGKARADLVAFPTGDARWVVTITSKRGEADASDSVAGAKPQIQEIEVTQSGKTRRVRFTWSNGKETEEWALPGIPVIFKEDPLGGSVYPVRTSTPQVQYINFSAPHDQSAFSWLAPDLLQDKNPGSYEGRRCFHYVGKRRIPSMGGSPNKETEAACEAWIDSATLEPVGFSSAEVTAKFVFDPKPPGPLEMPDRFKKEIDHYKEIVGYR